MQTRNVEQVNRKLVYNFDFDAGFLKLKINPTRVEI